MKHLSHTSKDIYSLIDKEKGKEHDYLDWQQWNPPTNPTWSCWMQFLSYRVWFPSYWVGFPPSPCQPDLVLPGVVLEIPCGSLPSSNLLFWNPGMVSSIPTSHNDKHHCYMLFISFPLEAKKNASNFILSIYFFMLNFKFPHASFI